MTPDVISKRVVVDRMAWLEQMLIEIKLLPLSTREHFDAETRNVWAAESCLRRALEALFDLSRHILAKGFAEGTTEYKEIVQKLAEHGVVSSNAKEIFLVLAGYRNRLVHFYHEVTVEELYDICANQLQDIETVQADIKSWLRQHPAKMDDIL